MSTIYQLSTYSLATISNAVAASSGTPTIIWSATIPAGAKGRNAILQVFFNLFCASNFVAGQNFYYGLYVDGVPLAIGDSTTMKYVHTAANQYAISAAGVGLGTNPLFGYQPLVIPLAISPSASQIQIGITNSTLAMPTGTSAQPHVASNVLTSTGTVGSNNYYPQNTFMTSGVGNYTVPTTVYSVGGTSNNVVGVFMYCWGCTGSAYGANCGSGGFVSGYYPCASGTTLQYVVGTAASTASPLIGGSGGGNGAGGGSFSGVFLSNSGGIVQSNALVIAGGGGQSMSVSLSGGGGGAGAYVTNASGVGYSGGASYIYGTGYSAVTGGTLSAGGSGVGNAAGALVGGGTLNNGSGGGGGYYGGGGGSFSATTGAGAGGSSFAANSILSPTFLPGINATSVGQFLYPPGGVTSPYYVTNSSNFGYGGSNIPGGATFNAYGLVVIVPAIGSTAVQVGVSASLYAL